MLKNTLDPENRPAHPGEILREDFLPSIAMSRVALARHLGISTGALRALIQEQRPVTFELAQLLGAALGTGTRYWVGLQAQFDIFRAEQAEQVRILPVAWRAKRAPVNAKGAALLKAPM